MLRLYSILSSLCVAFVLYFLVERIRLTKFEELVHTGFSVDIREFCWSRTLVLDPVFEVYLLIDKLLASYSVDRLGALVDDTLECVLIMIVGNGLRVWTESQ